MSLQANGFLLPIRISYCPPEWLVPLHFAIHLLAIFCLYFSGIHLALRVILLLIVTLSLLVRVFFSDTSWYRNCLLVLNADDQWLLVDGKQHLKYLHLVKTVILGTGMIILQFTDDGRGKQLFILTGKTVDTDSLRRLRVRLLFSKTGTVFSPSS